MRVLAVLLVLAGCGGEPEASPAALLSAAVRAHGGREALAQLESMHVRSEVVFRDRVALRREIHFRAPDAFAMEVTRDDIPVLSFGIRGDGCWTTHREFVIPCDAAAMAENRRSLQVLGTRLLHRLDPARAVALGAVSIDGTTLPAIGVGDMRLAFDPVTHLLVYVDYRDVGSVWIERFSEFTAVSGARVAMHRVLTIGGEADVTEQWTEVVPGGADPARLEPPAERTPGEILDAREGATPMAWVAIAERAECDGGVDAPNCTRWAEQALNDFLRGRGMRASGSDGMAIEWRESGTWVGAPIDEATTIVPVDAPPFQIQSVPAGRFVGVFHRGGDPRARELALRTAIETRGAHVQSGAPLRFDLAPGASRAPLETRFGILRSSVAP